MKTLLLLALLALPLSAQLPSRPPVDTDEACSVTCGEVAGTMTTDTPTYEEQAIIGDLARAWMRNAVYRKRVPTFWTSFGLETQGDLPWMSPPSQDWRPYRPKVAYCSKKMLLYSNMAGSIGWHCAGGVTLPDRIVISLADPANVRALSAWETCQTWTYNRFGLQTAEWVDGSIVAECAAWVVQALSGSRTTISKDIVSEPASAPKPKAIPD